MLKYSDCSMLINSGSATNASVYDTSARACSVVSSVDSDLGDAGAQLDVAQHSPLYTLSLGEEACGSWVEAENSYWTEEERHSGVF